MGQLSTGVRGARMVRLGVRAGRTQQVLRAFRPVVDGTIERTVQTAHGIYDFSAEVSTVGKVLKVDEIAFYPHGNIPVPTIPEMLRGFKAIKDEMAERGYEALDVIFHRTRSGREARHVFDLTK